MKKVIKNNYQGMNILALKRKIASKQAQKISILHIFQMLTTFISLISIYIACESLKLSVTEKGAMVEPKVITDMIHSRKYDTIMISVQNVSSASIGIKSAYFILYQIGRNDSVFYAGILNNQISSFSKLEPFAKQYDTLRGLAGGYYTPIDSLSARRMILELRLYYTRLFDGKTYGIRSFYGPLHLIEENRNFNIFLNEAKLLNNLMYLEAEPKVYQTNPYLKMHRKQIMFDLKIINKNLFSV